MLRGASPRREPRGSPGAGQQQPGRAVVGDKPYFHFPGIPQARRDGKGREEKGRKGKGCRRRGVNGKRSPATSGRMAGRRKVGLTAALPSRCPSLSEGSRSAGQPGVCFERSPPSWPGEAGITERCRGEKPGRPERRRCRRLAAKRGGDCIGSLPRGVKALPRELRVPRRTGAHRPQRAERSGWRDRDTHWDTHTPPRSPPLHRGNWAFSKVCYVIMAFCCH